ncbi:MAG TPA: hypothetical protein VHB21_08930 [Minicystis sp.]|nr:hypothetical protein [Minicystis sp.]
MPRPTETALRGRARALLEAMTERARWVYALPLEAAETHVRPILTDAGLTVEEEDAGARAARLSNAAGSAHFAVMQSPELDVTLVEGSGSEAPPLLAKILERTGFYAQTELLGTALDVRDEEAPKALRTLAHMVVGWDEDWSDLFLLHLASPDPVVRHDAALALAIAVMVAREPGPAPALLEEAIRREKFPKLAETLRETLNLVRGLTGGAVELPADG